MQNMNSPLNQYFLLISKYFFTTKNSEFSFSLQPRYIGLHQIDRDHIFYLIFYQSSIFAFVYLIIQYEAKQKYEKN